MQVGGRRPLARARTGAGVGPAGGTFWHGNVHFHKVFKGNLLQPLVVANSLVLQAILVIRVPVLKVMCRITVNLLIYARTPRARVTGHVAALPHGAMARRRRGW